MTQTQFIYCLIGWMACALLVVWGKRKNGSGSGLVISYVFQLWMMHWLAASIYALPWYGPVGPATAAGLLESTYGIAGFAIGSTLIVPFVLRQWYGPAGSHEEEWTPADPWLTRTYLVIGLFSYLVLAPAFHNVPTINAITSAMSNVLLLALVMGCWNGLGSDGRYRNSFLVWASLSAALPFLTMITSGFLGYGFVAMLTVFSFVASFYRPRWKLVVASLILGYLSLSMYVTYMRDRTEIRRVIWGQESYSTRLPMLLDTFTDFEFLDFRNIDHLERIDVRLNQDALIGLSVSLLDLHPERFAHGRTIWEAALSPIPRFLWPDKPTAAGSGNLVSEFTGLRFYGDTSVGIGHVMEWFVNFAELGVFFGMMGLGIVIGLIDRMAAEQLLRGDWPTFALLWLPGLGLLQAGGSLVETISTACAGLGVAVLIQRFRRRQPYVPVGPFAPRGIRPGPRGTFEPAEFR